MFSNYQKVIVVFSLAMFLSGCVYWRLLQTKLQLNEFDHYFNVVVANDFTWHFKKPLLYSNDFTYLAKLQPSLIETKSFGEEWQYLFRKITRKGILLEPQVSYFFSLKFNHNQRLTDFSLSPMFLKIAPAKFLEASLRSLGQGDIIQSKRQLKVSADKMVKITSPLPTKDQILKHLGPPLEQSEERDLDVMVYHFRLETPEIEEGYEDRALNEVKLWFDKQNQILVKLGGRFAGLKLRIDYRKYQRSNSEQTV